jgi:hypothetical protein
MNAKKSFLDELRDEYETVQAPRRDQAGIEEFDVIDARMRKSLRWLEKAVTYLDGIKSPVKHRFDLGYGMVFESPRFSRGTVGQHTRNILGFPAIDEINLYYEISATKPVTAQISTIEAELVKEKLEAANLRFTNRRIKDLDGVVRRCELSVPPGIPAAVIFRVNYKTGIVTLTLVNVDRFDQVSLAFQSSEIKESVLEDLTKFILGIDSALLRRAPMAGIRGKASS